MVDQNSLDVVEDVVPLLAMTCGWWRYITVLKKGWKAQELSPVLGSVGILPGSTLLHLRKLSFFGMICRLPTNIIHRHALNIFIRETISNKSWFHQIRDICLQNNLPHPAELLRAQLTKEQAQNLCRVA